MLFHLISTNVLLPVWALGDENVIGIRSFKAIGTHWQSFRPKFCKMKVVWRFIHKILVKCDAICKKPVGCRKMQNWVFGLILKLKSTQQNSYSISHLLGTVTTQWLPLWQCSHCSLVPDSVTIEQWLHRTHTLLGIRYHVAYVEICLLGT